MALSALWAYGLPWHADLAPVQALAGMELKILRSQLENNVNTPLTSSLGRLFDSVSALLGIRMEISYEAQAAIELEALAEEDELGYYPWRLVGTQINIKTVLEGILADLSQGETRSVIAARFHNTVAQLSLALAKLISEQYGIQKIALSGGVWQNQFLLNRTLPLLKQEGFQPLIHRITPPNDECVSLGQAVISAYRYDQNKE
jgi:hydrogenase maturation protein HypF